MSTEVITPPPSSETIDLTESPVKPPVKKRKPEDLGSDITKKTKKIDWFTRSTDEDSAAYYERIYRVGQKKGVFGLNSAWCKMHKMGSSQLPSLYGPPKLPRHLLERYARVQTELTRVWIDADHYYKANPSAASQDNGMY